MLFSKELTSDDKGDLAGVVGKIQRRLTGRVSGADEVDVVSMRAARFAARGAVIDPLADEPIEAVDREASPRDAGGKNERSCPDDVVPVQQHFARRWTDAGDGARDQNFSPEPLRLLQGATGKFVAGDPAGKSEIVLDSRGCPGLTTGGLALDNDRAQPFGCAVDRRRKTSWTAADNRDIVFAGARHWSADRGDLQHRAPAAGRSPRRRRAEARGNRRPVGEVQAKASPTPAHPASAN